MKFNELLPLLSFNLCCSLKSRFIEKYYLCAKKREILKWKGNFFYFRKSDVQNYYRHFFFFFQLCVIENLIKICCQWLRMWNYKKHEIFILENNFFFASKSKKYFLLLINLWVIIFRKYTTCSIIYFPSKITKIPVRHKCSTFF